MKLAAFIHRDIEPILVEWESFASEQLPAAAGMTRLALRDHAQQILEAVAADISAPQNQTEQVSKSKGHAKHSSGAPETAAQTHALVRAQSGFDINQMVSEYRALRSSVLRLWAAACEPEAPNADDTTRFNEAIDQALAESIAFFGAQVDQSRDLLLGMLGHDLRSPLQAILATAAYLNQLNAGANVSQAAARLIRSGGRMNTLLNDLVDFNRTQLGLGISIMPSEFDLVEAVSEEVQQLSSAHPDRQIELHVTGELRGQWDRHRLQQLLGNLVINALKYGAQDKAVDVTLTGLDDTIEIEVANSGPAIGATVFDQLFEPLSRGDGHDEASSREGSLGLGLYIAREIARAHGGEINVRSDEQETAFNVQLPRQRVGPGPVAG